EGGAVGRVDVAALRGVGADQDRPAAGGVLGDAATLEPLVLLPPDPVQQVDHRMAAPRRRRLVVVLRQDDRVARRPERRWKGLPPADDRPSHPHLLPWFEERGAKNEERRLGRAPYRSSFFAPRSSSRPRALVAPHPGAPG